MKIEIETKKAKKQKTQTIKIDNNSVKEIKDIVMNFIDKFDFMNKLADRIDLVGIGETIRKMLKGDE